MERQNLNQLKEENEKLQAEVESAQSDYEYIEKLARERLGLIKDGEQVIESLEHLIIVLFNTRGYYFNNIY